MKQAGKAIVTLAVLIVMLIPVSAAAQQATDEMSVWQAHRVLLAASQFMKGWVKCRWCTIKLDSISRESIRFTSDTFEFDVTNDKRGTEHHKVDLKAVGLISPWGSTLSYPDGTTKRWLCHLGVDAKTKFEGLEWEDTGNAFCSEECVRSLKASAIAINRLHAFAIDNGSNGKGFHQQAAAWRALATKRPLSEGARIHRLAAEDAINNQKPDDALNLYELGVESDPMWAQGWFNAAIIAGQLGYYADAAEHMQNYLELMPNAPDAQAARDQVDLWHYKAGQQPVQK